MARNYIVCEAGYDNLLADNEPIWEIELDDGSALLIPRSVEYDGSDVESEIFNIVHELRENYIKHNGGHPLALPKFKKEDGNSSKRISIDIDYFTDLISEIKRAAFINKLSEIEMKCFISTHEVI